MEQLMNTMLANAQLSQTAPTVKKSDSAQKDGFQKLMEQKQGSEAPAAPRQEKPETSEKSQEAQGSQQPQETEQPQETQTVPKDGKELEEQMVLAAMAMLQNPVVPAEEAAVRPAERVGAVMDQVAPLAAETAGEPETQVFVPVKERAVEIPAETGETGETQSGQPNLMEELPETIQAPDKAQHTEERTVEVKVETGEANAQTAQAEEAGEETPELQEAGGETPVFEEVKAVPVKVGEAPKTQETQQPVEKQIAPKLTEALQNGETRVELQLTPENLGKVTVEMTWSKDGGLVVQMHAENRGTQNLLEKNLSGLETLLSRETQQEVRVEVPRQEESQRQDLYEQQQNQHRRQQQEERKSQQSDSENFLQQLRLGLIPMEGE
ncbi:flagellar hook-length control protein FliK [uncultured Oscillibacter sp.]|uniref:flagellar hook-length control protein FliK n=1 Tax=uncultured Oscillibacter sp. TaxID=876091 RepID=UPI0025FB0F3D|nr:flagellar hook-length control protein FliK [uncultured Oscillibacter sp.]